MNRISRYSDLVEAAFAAVADPNTTPAELESYWEQRKGISSGAGGATGERFRAAMAVHPNLPARVARALVLARPEYLAESPVLVLLFLETPELQAALPPQRIQALLRHAELSDALLELLRLHPHPEVAQWLEEHVQVSGELGEADGDALAAWLRKHHPGGTSWWANPLDPNPWIRAMTALESNDPAKRAALLSDGNRYVRAAARTRREGGGAWKPLAS